ncbi:MAG: hypothetical protein ACM3VW_04505 [Bacteroidota bacterium]
MSLTDYRDRASVMIWVVLMGLAAQRFLVLPERAFTSEIFGSPITLTITANTILAVLLTGLVATGTEAVVRAHPKGEPSPAGRVRRRAYASIATPVRPPALSPQERAALASRSHWVYWGAPVALILVAIFLLPLAPSAVYWVLGLIAAGVTLGLALAGIYYTIDPFQTGYRRARLGMNALTYALALLLFLVVYRTRTRSVLSATEVLLVSTLLAMELLRGSERPTVMVALYAGIAGLVLGQATWALNYWRLDSLTGGLVLLVLFYDVVGLSQHALQGHVRRRIVVEYALITITAIALIWEFAP